MARAVSLNFSACRSSQGHVVRFDLDMVFREVVAVRLSSRNVFLPDLAFYRTERLGLQRDNHIDGAPDLAVEMLSPRTAHRDVGVTFVEYDQHGVEEYWVLGPESLAHRFYTRDGDLITEFAVGDAVVRSTVLPSLPLRCAWLTPDQPPKVEACLAISTAPPVS